MASPYPALCAAWALPSPLCRTAPPSPRRDFYGASASQTSSNISLHAQGLHAGHSVKLCFSARRGAGEMAGDQSQRATGGFVRGECAPPRDGHKAHEAKAWPHPLLCFRHPWRFADLQLSSRPASSHFTAFISSSPRPVNRRFQDRPAADKQVPRQRILRTEIHPTAVWYQRANPGTVGSGRAWPCEVNHQGYLDPITGIYSLA